MVGQGFDLYDMDVGCGKDILYLYVCAPAYCIAVILADTLLQYPAIAARIFKDPDTRDEQDSAEQDEDVAREALRVPPRPCIVLYKTLYAERVKHLRESGVLVCLDMGWIHRTFYTL